MVDHSLPISQPVHEMRTRPDAELTADVNTLSRVATSTDDQDPGRRLHSNAVSRTVTLTNNSDLEKVIATGSDTGENSEVIKAEVDEVPDGGYGWVVVGACATTTFFVVGLTYSWGVLQAVLAQENLASDSTLSFIGSIAIAMIALGAIVNTRLILFLGTRNAAVLASCLIGLSQILCGWATKSIPGLFICYSFIGGMGYCILYMCKACGTLPAQYFKKKRGIASGVIYAGGGIGGGVLSISMEVLVDRVGVPWTFRMMGFLSLAFTLPASLLLKERVPRGQMSVDWSLFRDLKFVFLFIGSGIATFSLLVPPFFIPTFATTLGISPTLGSILLAVFNIASAFGRVGFGYLGDIVGPTTSLLLSLLLNTISIFAIWPQSRSLGVFIVFIVLNGMGGGGFFSTVPPTVSSIFGPSRTPTALSMIMSAWAAGYTMGAPIAGYILNNYGGSTAGLTAFRPGIFYAGAMSLGSSLFIFGAHQLRTKKLFAYA